MLSKFRNSDEALIIAEVGQNHQGSVELARRYIKEFSAAGANVIKFQTRDNKSLFSKEAYLASYNSENAFAATYGEHREKLELPVESLSILKRDCDENDVQFMSTPFDEPSLERLCEAGVDIIKVASFDIGNLPFLRLIGQKRLPTIISIGGGKIDQIRASIDMVLQFNDDLAILHCVSEYPCPHNRLGLKNIDLLLSEFPQLTIGLSDHFNGIVSGPIAYMRGARIFEKHVTFDRSWKGTDHSFALNPHGFKNFVRDIRRVPEMISPKCEDDIGKEPVFQKLGKSIVAKFDLEAGETLCIENLSGKIFQEQFIPVRECNEVVGKRIHRFIKAGEPIVREDFS